MRSGTKSTETAGAHPPVDETTTRSRKRFARRQWSRRWVAWRYVVALVLLIALLVGAVWLAFFSSVLAVEGVEVHGTKQLSSAQVRAAAEVTDGEPLARVDLDAIRARVEALAEVRSADVTRQWPHEVRIEIEERVAIAVVEIGGQVRGMDRDGVVFREYRQPPPGLPRVQTSSGTDTDALREAGAVVSAMPQDLASRVDHVEVETIDRISLVLQDGRTVMWGSADQSAEKAEVLATLLHQDAQRYDVSVPAQPTTSD
jgi:cell division protein FtsQ